ncbi:CalY family protein [Candidatus Parcubacteria bacterium]|nr:CalY family protein [Candidatus Parcubacteria bacterium]
MKKILLSIATLAIVGAIAVGATGAFYGDVETSTGNTFTAGSIELKVDSTSHYNGMVCTKVGDIYTWQPETGTTQPYYPVKGSPCDGTWSETNLTDGVQKFFNFSDLKPGDKGEDTISLHVYNNDAWGQFVIASTTDADNTCTGPEIKAETNLGLVCDEINGDGEMDENLLFTGWLDQGATAGFQNVDAEGNVIDANPSTPEIELVDVTEGDNSYQEYEGQKFWNNEKISNLTHNIGYVLVAEYLANCTQDGSPDGHNSYGRCQGLAADGRMVGSTTYYFGLAWDLPLATGNEVQSDEYTADLSFRVEQHRNNPNPFPILTEI